MKLTEGIVKWLEENAYEAKGTDYWFLACFPSEQIPDRLEIPINKRSWEKLKVGVNSSGEL